MIDSMDIYRALRETLEKNFKKIKVQTKDIKNPRPPCFYIKLITDNGNQTASEFETTTYSYAVIYFSKKETVEDLLTVKEGLKKIFKKPLQVIAFEDPEDINYVEINGVNTNLDEDGYVLTLTLAIEHTQPLGVERFESENNEIMDEMELNIDSYK